MECVPVGGLPQSKVLCPGSACSAHNREVLNSQSILVLNTFNTLGTDSPEKAEHRGQVVLPEQGSTQKTDSPGKTLYRGQIVLDRV